MRDSYGSNLSKHTAPFSIEGDRTVSSESIDGKAAGHRFEDDWFNRSTINLCGSVSDSRKIDVLFMYSSCSPPSFFVFMLVSKVIIIFAWFWYVFSLSFTESNQSNNEDIKQLL